MQRQLGSARKHIASAGLFVAPPCMPKFVRCTAAYALGLTGTGEFMIC